MLYAKAKCALNRNFVCLKAYFRKKTVKPEDFIKFYIIFVSNSINLFDMIDFLYFKF